MAEEGKEVDKTGKEEEKLPVWGKLDDPRKPSDLIGFIKRTKTFFSVCEGLIVLNIKASVWRS